MELNETVKVKKTLLFTLSEYNKDREQSEYMILASKNAGRVAS